MHTTRAFVLASASPRRAELLRQAGFAFSVVPSHVDETNVTASETDPVALARKLAFLKADAVAISLSDRTVLGADTVVSAGDRIYGKPSDQDDARRILTDLMHRTHEVITAVALVDADTRRHEIAHDVTCVTMRPMPDDVFEKYLRSRLWDGKAGAYGIQDHGDSFVERIEGSFSNVVGLPMELLTRLMASWGHQPSRPPPTDEGAKTKTEPRP